MSMNVCGLAPINDTGTHFRNNMWWHPLWSYCEHVAPDLTKGVHCRVSDGDGLDAKNAAELASILTAEIDNGGTGLYASEYDDKVHTMRDEICGFCMGTGKSSRCDRRPWWKLWRRWLCTACGGKGYSMPDETNYLFTLENVIAFL